MNGRVRRPPVAACGCRLWPPAAACGGGLQLHAAAACGGGLRRACAAAACKKFP